MTLVIDTGDSADGVITLNNPISGTWELVYSDVEYYPISAVPASNNTLIISSDSGEDTITFPTQETLDVAALAQAITTGIVYCTEVAVDGYDTTKNTIDLITDGGDVTIEWTDGSTTADLLFVNTGADKVIADGETGTIRLRERKVVSHFKVTIAETYRRSVSSTGQTPTFVVSTNTDRDIPNQTMNLVERTDTLTFTIREMGSDVDIDFDLAPAIVLTLNKV